MIRWGGAWRYGKQSIRLENNVGVTTQDLAALTLEEFLAKEYATETVIAEGILDLEGMILVEGPTEAGKSYFVLQLAFELATGQSFLGRWSVERPFRVLLIQSEIGPRRFQLRAEKLARNFTAPGDYLRLKTHFTLKLDRVASGLQLLDEAISDYGTEVVMLDPMRTFHLGDENSSQDMERFLGNLKLLQEKHGVAMVLTHHERKPSELTTGRNRGSQYEARGSSLITDRPDTVLRLSRGQQPDRRRLTFEKLRNGDESKKPEPCELFEDTDSGLFLLLNPDAESTALKQGEILDLIHGGEPVELKELKRTIASRFSVNVKTAEHKLNEMERQGLIEKYEDPTDGRKKLVRVKLREGE